MSILIWRKSKDILTLVLINAIYILLFSLIWCFIIFQKGEILEGFIILGITSVLGLLLLIFLNKFLKIEN